MHQIQLSDEAFLAYQRRAKSVGLTVEEYLDRSAPADEFALTPEMREGIERGLAQADVGQTVGLMQVRETLAEYKAKWRESGR